MKRRRGNLPGKIVSVFLAALLFAGMVSEAASVEVFAGEFKKSRDSEKVFWGDTPGELAGREEGEPEGKKIVEESGEEGNATVTVTFRVYGYDSGRWKQVKGVHNDWIVEKGCEVTEVSGNGFTDVTYTYKLEVKQWDNFYLDYDNKLVDAVGDAISPGDACTWGPVSFYPVTFMDEGQVFDVQYVEENREVSRPGAEPSKSGYIFNGWVTSPGGSALFAFESDIPSHRPDQPAGTKITSAVNIYASWTKEGGEDSPIPITALEASISGFLAPAYGEEPAMPSFTLIKGQPAGVLSVFWQKKQENGEWKNMDSGKFTEGTYRLCVVLGLKENEKGYKILDSAVFTVGGQAWQKAGFQEGSAGQANCITMCSAEYSVVSLEEEGKEKISKDIETGENAPKVSISASAKDLGNMVLTEEEKKQAENGTEIKIILSVKDGQDTVTAGDRAAVSGALKDFSLGQYLDISLYKIVGGNRSAVTQTAGNINITIVLPEGLANNDAGKTRRYGVIRVHNGQADLLKDLDSSPETVTISTDRFSTYAIVYQDKEAGNEEEDDNNDVNAGGDNNGNNSSTGSNSGGNTAPFDSAGTKPGKKDSEPKTGDRTAVEIYATLAMIAGFGYLLAYFAEKGKGMTKEEKNRLVSELIRWAYKGGRLKKLAALTAVGFILAYYHSIGKYIAVEWKEAYEK